MLEKLYFPDTSREAKQWCEEQAVSTLEALSRITGISPPQPLKQQFREIFATAEKIADQCPVKMGGAGNIDLLYWIAEHIKAQHVLETGIAYGWSSLAILLSITNHKNALLVSTDIPYPGRNNDNYVGCVVPENMRTHWQIIRRPDREAIPEVLKKLHMLDMVHYDSDKTYHGRIWAYPLLWTALKEEGCFISDDVGDNVAFRDFCHQIHKDPIIVQMRTNPIKLLKPGSKYVGILVKTLSE